MAADEKFLLQLLQACDALAPLYPARFAQQEKIERQKLDAGLDELRRRGLVQFTEWVRVAGQGYAVTATGRQALAVERLPTGRAVPSPAETATSEGIGTYERGEIVRSAIYFPSRPYVAWTLVAINLFYFGYGALFTWQHDGSVIDYLQGDAVIREENRNASVIFELGALWPPNTIPERGSHRTPEPYRLITSLFLHIGILHLCMNMYFLGSLGGTIESMWGKARFLAIYLVAGLTSGCVVILIDRIQDTDQITAGASGALFGIFMAMLVWFWLNQEHLPTNLIQDWSRAFAINSFLLLAINFWPGVSWQGHLGGAIGGGLAALLLHVNRFHPSPVVRWAAVAAVPMIPAAFFVAVLWQANWL